MPKVSNRRVTRRPKRQAVPYGTLIPQYTPGIKNTRLPIEFYIGKFATTVTTGVISLTQAIESVLIPSFSSRFSVFDEYLIESVLVRINTCSSTIPGLINVWFEPNISSSGAPNATDAKDNKTLTFSASSCMNTHTLSFNPRNPGTQSWTPVSTSTTPIGYFKMYTDNANFASSTAATDYAVVTGVMTVCFRGFG